MLRQPDSLMIPWCSGNCKAEQHQNGLQVPSRFRIFRPLLLFANCNTLKSRLLTGTDRMEKGKVCHQEMDVWDKICHQETDVWDRAEYGFVFLVKDSVLQTFWCSSVVSTVRWNKGHLRPDPFPRGPPNCGCTSSVCLKVPGCFPSPPGAPPPVTLY